MTLKQVKLLAITIIALPVFLVSIYNADQVQAVPVSADAAAVAVTASGEEDIAAIYKAKCTICHKANAEKWFEPSKMDEVLIEIVLKGKKAEKPPHMPGYEEKGMTKEQAKLLVAYMRQMRTPPSK